MPAHPQFSSSVTTTWVKVESTPPPPYASGMNAVSRPRACAFRMISHGTVPLRSYSNARGLISRSANSCAVFCMSRCSSVSSKSTMVFFQSLLGSAHESDDIKSFEAHPARMRVFVAGATGVLGRRLVRQLVARGHSAVGLTRNEAGDRLVRSLGGEPRRANLFDAASPRKAAGRCTVAVHGATAVP